jgi:hypothetical protein
MIAVNSGARARATSTLAADVKAALTVNARFIIDCRKVA